MPHPGEGCWRKVLGDVDRGQNAQRMDAEPARKLLYFVNLLSIDAVNASNPFSTIVSLVDAIDGSLPQALWGGNVFKTLSGDALYSNKNLVREISKNAAARYMFNSRPIRKPHWKKPRRLNQSAPPFYTQLQNRTRQ